MGNYDLSVQKNIDKKMSEFGMVLTISREVRSSSTPSPDTGTCDPGCVRSLEYLRRIVKSLLRQMNVKSHVFGPGEAITIDLQAELKYDDYTTLYKFMNSNQESDKFLYRIDEIMSNFIHVVEHSSSRFDFLDSIIHFSAFYSLKFWIILLMASVVCTLIFILFAKLIKTSSVYHLLLYGFLIVFIVSCVWSYSSSYEDKKAEIHAHMAQHSGRPPPDCDYTNWNAWESIGYFFRVSVFRYKDRCQEHYATTMTDPLWKVNPIEAVSTTASYLIFSPLDYIGSKLGSFFTNFIESAPLILKPVMLAVAILLSIIIIYGPFRISTPLLTIEPAWRPQLTAPHNILQHQQVHVIGPERVRNEIMERPDGPVVKSVRDAVTDMDGFQEYLTDEGTDELEIIGPFARFNLEEASSVNSTRRNRSSCSKPASDSIPLVARNVKIENAMDDKSSCSSSSDDKSTSTVTVTSAAMVVPKIERTDDLDDNGKICEYLPLRIPKMPETVKMEPVKCASLPDSRIQLVKEELLRDALREDPNISSEDILP